MKFGVRIIFKTDAIEEMFEAVIPLLEMVRDEHKNGDLN